jgi:iron-sulfur cluster repair protein YtfE (RIC family)
MKRHEQLKTLSWEHHDGLVVAFRLQQGLKKGTPPNVLKNYILHVWETVLKNHFWQEEEIINPHLEQSRKGLQIKEQMMDDHIEFRKKIDTLEHNSAGADQIGALAEILNRHIRFEERQLLPFIETNISATELEKMGIFLREHHATTHHNWHPAFWSADSSL